MDNKKIFTEIYKTNGWRSKESVSGNGSTLAATARVRELLPALFKSLDVRSVLDIPCGDFYWLYKMWLDAQRNNELPPFLKYIGGDIVPDLVASNRERFLGFEFQVLDASYSRLPKVDLILCRDMLGHLPNRDGALAIKNFRKSGSSWLLATTFPHSHNGNVDIRAGEWRPLDLSDIRFGLGKPLRVFSEGVTGKWSGKSLGLWRLN